MLVFNKFTFELDNFTNLLVKALDLFSKVDGFCLTCLYKKKVEKTVERSIDLKQETIKGTERASPIYTLFHR